ncbi:MAG: helicase-related protein, partial [Sarcina sp.]
EEVTHIIREHEAESGIIYCASRKEVDELYSVLRDIGFSVLKYHGGMKEDEKTKNQEAFLNEEKNIMIATNAFGMGIDKSNIRYIIHFTMPKNLESYYQEIGRGGRDGEACDCYLFFNRIDIKRVEFLINKSVPLGRRQIAIGKLQSMIDYCEYDGCLRGYLLDYFNNDKKMSFCNNCTNCLNSEKVRDFTKEAQMILSTVFRTREGYGISVITDILRGIKGPKIIRDELDQITTFGLMRESSSKFIKEVINGLLENGDVSLKEGTYSMLKLNNESIKVLKSEKEVLMILENIEEEILDKVLYEKLKVWRRVMAGKENIRPYIIFSDTSLINIANIKPKTKDELMSIRGMGEKKLLKYGDELLNIVNRS